MNKPTISLTLGWILAFCHCVHSTSFERIIDLGSHRLQCRSAGTGTPVVVIDAGLADSLDKYKTLQERLTDATQVITYNRAGYGQSEPGPLPRHSGREADELKAMLEKASIPGPYVLVGHSLGALNMQVFASKYAKDVVGILLLDPPPLSFLLGREYKELAGMAEKMTAEWQAIADAAGKSDDSPEKAKSAFFRAIASEHREMFGETARLVSGINGFGDTPLIVMAAGKPNPAFGDLAEKFQNYWIEQSRIQSEKSRRGKFLLMRGSSHFLYVDALEPVLETILSLVHQARRK